MLVHHLNLAIEMLQSLIDITKSDITDIKQAKHEKLFARLKAKEELLSSFENFKNLIDAHIVEMATQNSGSDLESILSKEQRELLDSMRQKLNELKSTNKHYAKLVIAINTFYNSLIEQIVPPKEQKAGYIGMTQRRSAMLETKA